MRNYIFLLLCLFFVADSFAQDTVERKNRLSDSVIERFYVLKTNPDIKQGPYKAYFRRRTLIASGYYKKDMRAGIWYFYNTTGRMIEKYNFDIKDFLFEGPLDTADDLTFKFDTVFQKTDTVTRPLKIGGSYFGFVPYVTAFKLPFDTMDVNINSFDASVELLITPLGRLAYYKVRLTSDEYKYDHTFNLDTHLFSEADQTFQPAMVNGTAVICRLFIKCYITSAGDLDFY